MRRLLAVVLGLTLVFSVGCSGDDSSSDETSTEAADTNTTHRTTPNNTQRTTTTAASSGEFCALAATAVSAYVLEECGFAGGVYVVMPSLDC